MKKNTGSRWEITVDAVSRTYRHDRTIAIESAKYLKLKQPMTDVVRDLEGLEETVVISAHFRVHKAPSSAAHRKQSRRDISNLHQIVDLETMARLTASNCWNLLISVPHPRSRRALGTQLGASQHLG
jgi:hypothetical protein